jgi:hypothetical protein
MLYELRWYETVSDRNQRNYSQYNKDIVIIYICELKMLPAVSSFFTTPIWDKLNKHREPGHIKPVISPFLADRRLNPAA